MDEVVRKLVAEAEAIINDEERRTSKDVQRLSQIRTEIRACKERGQDVVGQNIVLFTDITDRREAM